MNKDHLGNHIKGEDKLDHLKLEGIFGFGALRISDEIKEILLYLKASVFFHPISGIKHLAMEKYGQLIRELLTKISLVYFPI